MSGSGLGELSAGAARLEAASDTAAPPWVVGCSRSARPVSEATQEVEMMREIRARAGARIREN